VKEAEVGLSAYTHPTPAPPWETVTVSPATFNVAFRGEEEVFGAIE
jgi:hypothetical protein